MDTLSAQEPLLPSNGGDHGSVSTEKKTELAFSLSLSLVAQWILKIVMWSVFIAWVAFILVYPLNSGNNLVKKWTHDSVGTFLGIEGPAFLIFSGPVFIIAILSVPYLSVSGKDKLQEKKSTRSTTLPSYRLSTFPLLVDGRLGVVSASEFIVILVFALSIIWVVYVYTIRNLSTIDEAEFSSDIEKICLTLEVFGISLGLIGLFCLAFLFLPIARGSALLRLIDVPFGHAVRYHIWLGNLTMLIFTLHGLFYITAWSLEGDVLERMLEWPDSGVVNLAGVIALTSGLLMWITSLPFVRKRYFEVFFYTHQLYMIFVLFLALHVGVIFFSMAAGSIFLFMVDRFLRFCQSRKSVDIVSATCFPGGIVNMVLSKPENLQCDALSFIFLRVPQVSLLQWHPFSISSTSLGGEHHLSILIKVVGQWTAKLKENISNISRPVHEYDQEGINLQSLSKLTASVEGPYGHELPPHLMYEKLVLIAGGIGISPFLAALSDIFYRISHRRPCLLKSIVVVWAVKRSAELSLLSMVDKKLINTSVSNEVNLNILIYVTQESEPPLEEGAVDCKTSNSYVWPLSTGNKMSTLVGKSSDMWFGIYLISTIVAFSFLLCLLNIFYIKPYSIPTGWYEGLLFVACMVASVLIFGGIVVGLWHLWESKSLQSNCQDDGKKIEIAQDKRVSGNYDYGSSTTIRYGSRPDIQDIFESVSAQWGTVNVGVIVCGPPSLETSVAKECRSSNTRRQHSHPIFHFHSHSFSL